MNETKQTEPTWHHCPKCGKSHHMFTNPPSWKNKQAVCGQWFDQDGFAIMPTNPWNKHRE